MNLLFALALGLAVALVARRFVPGRDLEGTIGVIALGLLGAVFGNLFSRFALRMPADAYFVFFSSAFMSAWFIAAYRSFFRRNPPPIKVQRILALPRVPEPIVRMRRPFERDVVFMSKAHATPVPASPATATVHRLLLNIEKAP